MLISYHDDVEESGAIFDTFDGPSYLFCIRLQTFAQIGNWCSLLRPRIEGENRHDK